MVTFGEWWQLIPDAIWCVPHGYPIGWNAESCFVFIGDFRPYVHRSQT